MSQVNRAPHGISSGAASGGGFIPGATRLFDPVVNTGSDITLQVGSLTCANGATDQLFTLPTTGLDGVPLEAGNYLAVKLIVSGITVTLLGSVDESGVDFFLDIEEQCVWLVYSGAADGNTWRVVANYIDMPRAYRWTWANAAERHLQVVSAEEVGLRGYQTDIALEYQLLSDGPGELPVRWGPLADPSMGLVHNHGAQNSTTSALGLFQMSITQGTGASRTQSATNALTKLMRFAISSTAVAGTSAAYRNGSTQGGAFVGGFRWRMQFGYEATSAACFHFAGFSDTIPGAGGADPATLLDCVGVGRSAADANMQIIHNDGSGAGTKHDAGAGFPATGANLAYELELYSFDGTSFAYQLTNLSTGEQVSGTFSTNLPKLTPIVGSTIIYIANNSNASIVTLNYANQQFWSRVA